METQEQYFHLPPELRQLMLLGAKPPLYPADGFCSTGPEAPHLPSPPLPPPPHSSHHPIPLASSSANNDAAAGDNGFCPPQGRWPRQETLTLLEIRTRLDPKFRESGQKAALWDEIARIMAEEYGYQRSGRKCREKLDNLYKYYKKTKEGKAGRQDGKHYRFFRQLEALYGGAAAVASIPVKLESTSFNCRPGILESMEGLCFSTSTESSGEEAGCEEEVEEGVLVEGSGSSRRRRVTRPRMAELIDAQLKRLVEMQGAWFEKMLQSMERMEEERLRREEAWRREEAARQERERRSMASERAWGEAREAALLRALERIVRRREGEEAAKVAEGGKFEEEIIVGGVEGYVDGSDGVMAVRGKKKRRGETQCECDDGGDLARQGLISSLLIGEGQVWCNHMM